LKELKNISIEEPDSIRTTYYENILGIHSKLKTIIALSKDPSDNESDLIKITKDLCYQIKDVLDNIPDNYKKALFETREISHELLCSHEAINKRYKDICELLGIDTTDTSVKFLEDLVSLLTKYRVGILFVDHEKLTRKFSKQYKNFFGRLLGGYKKNISLLKSLSIDGKINEESILSDLITAGKVAEKLGEIKIDFDKEKLVSMLLVLKETIEKYKKSLDNLFETLKITNTSVSKFLENLKFLEIFQKPDGFHNEISFNLDWLQDMLHTVENLKSLLENISALVDIGNLVENGFIRDYESTLAFFNDLEEELPNIDEWFSLKNNVQILRENGLEDFLKKTGTKRDQSSNLVNIFLKGFFSDLLSKFYEEDKILGMLSKQERLSLIEEFKELDIKQQSIARHRLVSHLASKMPEIDVVQVESAETSILKREISKKRRNKSIRRLFSETPNLIKALKPCMMMSPLSVSIFLDPQFFKFDVVIFDEASQVFPEDAVGAIMRGKQIVVVGDNKQLPPTSFFKVSETETELEDHEEDLESLESILDECMTAGLPQKSLLWHYRSKHESLISFSNYHFYKNRLNTFPSSIFDGQDSGIDFCYVENGVYDRSKSRKNKIEAMKVAEMVLKHAQNKP
ncbi:MAG TPA: helicase, partial [Bacteroidetes bacterium]|nr:helicase [Bacteroidota bacterium]